MRRQKSFSSLNGAVHTVFGRINPHYLIFNGSTIVVIDVGFNSDADLILDYTQKWLNCGIEIIKLIVTTHYHFDHINGVDYLANKTGAELAAHMNAQKYYGGSTAPSMLSGKELLRLTYLWLKDLCPLPTMHDLLAKPIAGIPGIRKGLRSNPKYWLQDSQDLPFAPAWTVIYTKGHTDDSICLYNEKLKALISGDTIINVGGTLKLNPVILSDIVSGKNSLKKLQQLKIDHIYPGYGRPISRSCIIAEIE